MKQTTRSLWSSLALVTTAFFLLMSAPVGQAETAGVPASWEEIVARATAENKPIVLEFTGSDWCPPCKMMAKQVFSTPDFQKFAQSEIVFEKLDFPRSKKLPEAETARNEALAQQFSIEGFPTMVVLTPQGKEIARHVGYMNGGPQAFISWVKSAQQ